MANPGDPLLIVRGLDKAYAAPILAGIDFELHAGEVHALVGENGAGKSTFSRILAGLTQPDRGSLTLRGAPYAPQSRTQARRAGVRMVLQELNLIPTLTVAESLFLERLPQRWGFLDRTRLDAAARPLLARVGLAHLDPATPIRRLGIGQQQLVEIAAGVSERCDLLILDEPTAALTDPEIALLFEQIRRLQADGTAVLYISHRLEEIRRLCDRLSVLRDGRLVATGRVADFPLPEVVRLMVGRELDAETAPPAVSPGPVALRVENLCREPAVRDVSFEARRGEILGFAGLMGSGRTETVRALCGADRPRAGQVFLHGSPVPARIRSPRDAVRQGLALLTEDRKSQGLLLPWSVRANITLATLRRFHRGGWLRRRAEHAAAAQWADRVGIRCTSTEQRAAELSGGNQQKVVIAKWLLRDCDILVFDEPTRGIDVGARLDIYRLLRQLADRGKAVLVVSSDLRELLALCDRLLVMSAGRIAGAFRRGEASQEQILTAALSGYLPPAPA